MHSLKLSQDRSENGEQHGRTSVGIVKKTKEGIRMPNGLARSLIFPQHTIVVLHRKHSSVSPQPWVHYRYARSRHQPRVPPRLRSCSARFGSRGGEEVLLGEDLAVAEGDPTAPLLGHLFHLLEPPFSEHLQIVEVKAIQC